jgi:hypothetical protein
MNADTGAAILFDNNVSQNCSSQSRFLITNSQVYNLYGVKIQLTVVCFLRFFRYKIAALRLRANSRPMAIPTDIPTLGSADNQLNIMITQLWTLPLFYLTSVVLAAHSV